eukprot:TRINITY_DN4023_c0_g1_i1.p1 TRINITY_DN4023_c0_g1~~TRINITY_DN4023_c0_g1_i1.p1  ORF type:complete len:247 (-),score=66.68 TRINITY_DN4023_c0_g1_i1:42-782(-)
MLRTKRSDARALFSSPTVSSLSRSTLSPRATPTNHKRSASRQVATGATQKPEKKKPTTTHAPPPRGKSGPDAGVATEEGVGSGASDDDAVASPAEDEHSQESVQESAEEEQDKQEEQEQEHEHEQAQEHEQEQEQEQEGGEEEQLGLEQQHGNEEQEGSSEESAAGDELTPETARALSLEELRSTTAKATTHPPKASKCNAEGEQRAAEEEQFEDDFEESGESGGDSGSAEVELDLPEVSEDDADF